MKTFIIIKKEKKKKHFISCFYYEPDLCVCERDGVSEGKQRIEKERGRGKEREEEGERMELGGRERAVFSACSLSMPRTWNLLCRLGVTNGHRFSCLSLYSPAIDS